MDSYSNKYSINYLHPQPVCLYLDQGKESFDSDSTNFVYAVDYGRKRKTAWPVKTLDDLVDHFTWIKGHKVLNHFDNGKPFHQNGMSETELFFFALYYARLDNQLKISWINLLRKLIIHYELEVKTRRCVPTSVAKRSPAAVKINCLEIQDAGEEWPPITNHSFGSSVSLKFVFAT